MVPRFWTGCFVAAMLTAAGTTGLTDVSFADGPMKPWMRAPEINQNVSAAGIQWPELRRLPPVAETVAPPRPADGIWRQDGQDLIIDLNGQQFRLAHAGPETVPAASPQIRPNGGEVYGRLSDQGKPVANCEVALVPLAKTWSGYTIVGSDESVAATTDGKGVYHFTGVPPGHYKLRWRPAEQVTWIRRAEIQPDVRLRANETAQLKEISVALRTIN